jgi:spore germination protein GerM
MKQTIVAVVITFIVGLGIGYYVGYDIGFEKAMLQQGKNVTDQKQATRSVFLYYYNPQMDKDETGNVMCTRNGLTPVQRIIPVSTTPMQDTIRLLLQGQLTQEERDQGIGTEYPLEGVQLTEASLANGELTLLFADPNNKTVGGSCRVSILWLQIEETALQFPEVQKVRFIPEELFQP